MKIIETTLPGLLIIEPEIFTDTRGFFMETFNTDRYAAYGIPGDTLHFVQDNHSHSCKGVLRGLHFQRTHPQGKLISVMTGCVFDVVADVNPDSPTYGRWVGTELSEKNHLQLWVPPGYAHGYCVLSDIADFQYKCTDFYCPEDEGGVLWDDPDVGIDWPLDKPLLSAKDAKLPHLAEVRWNQLPRKAMR